MDWAPFRSVCEQNTAVRQSSDAMSRANKYTVDHYEEQILLEESTFDMRTSPICLAVILQRHDIVCLLLEKGCSELHPLSDIGTSMPHWNKSLVKFSIF